MDFDASFDPHARRPGAPEPAGTSEWKPLLSGTAADRARQLVFSIAEDLQTAPAPTNPYVAAGSAGWAVLLDYLFQVFSEPLFAKAAQKHLHAAADALEDGAHGPALFQGFAGVGLVASLHAEMSGEDPALEAIDEAVALAVEAMPAASFDLISGLAGLGVYLSRRWVRGSARGQLENVVDRLHRSALQLPDGQRCWWTPPNPWNPLRNKHYPHGLLDLGVAHGAAGVLSVLADIYLCEPSPATASLIEGVTSWLLSHRRPSGQVWSFPDFVSPEHEASEQPSRAAWCYGDPGIALALWKAGAACRKGEWRRIGHDVFSNIALRSAEDCFATDACVCHGSAGLAHLMNRMYQLTGDEALAEGSRRWFERTCSMAIHSDGSAGLLFWSAPGTDRALEWRTDRSLLGGAAGVALALASAITTVPPRWDCLLALDGPALLRASEPSSDS